jgi:hypothetical protein
MFTKSHPTDSGVMQELIYRAGRLIEHGRQLVLGIGANDRSAFDTSSAVHSRSSPDALPDEISLPPFAPTLTTTWALDPRSFGWFEASVRSRPSLPHEGEAVPADHIRVRGSRVLAGVHECGASRLAPRKPRNCGQGLSGFVRDEGNEPPGAAIRMRIWRIATSFRR